MLYSNNNYANDVYFCYYYKSVYFLFIIVNPL